MGSSLVTQSVLQIKKYTSALDATEYTSASVSKALKATVTWNPGTSKILMFASISYDQKCSSATFDYSPCFEIGTASSTVYLALVDGGSNYPTVQSVGTYNNTGYASKTIFVSLFGTDGSQTCAAAGRALTSTTFDCRAYLYVTNVGTTAYIKNIQVTWYYIDAV